MLELLSVACSEENKIMNNSEKASPYHHKELLRI